MIDGFSDSQVSYLLMRIFHCHQDSRIIYFLSYINIHFLSYISLIICTYIFIYKYMYRNIHITQWWGTCAITWLEVSINTYMCSHLAVQCVYIYVYTCVYTYTGIFSESCWCNRDQLVFTISWLICNQTELRSGWSVQFQIN